MSKSELQQKDRRSSVARLFNAIKFSAALALPLAGGTVYAADLATLQKLPLFTLDGMEYVGGFRLPANTYGASDVTYAEGPITLGANGASMFVVGHAQVQAVGEFKIPALVNSLNVSSFNTATVSQNFSKLLSRPASGNPQGIDTVGGMAYVNGRLLVNGYQYYDATGAVTDTTLVVNTASNLAGSSVGGYLRLPGRAHASGWISPVPQDWQTVLGGTHISGNSSGKPIISRLSVGPSAFAFNPASPDAGTLSPSTSLATTTLMDFSLDNPMGIGTQSVESYLAGSGTMWNHLSHAAYGFVVPGTRTYMAVGSTGGVTSGVGYKITQDNGNLCGGYCSYKVADNYNYYWMFDLNDLLKVKSGQMSPYAVKPYAHGKFNKSYASNGFNAIIGGAFDSAKGILYLSLYEGDRFEYGWAPLIVAFKVNTTTAAAPATPAAPSAPSNIGVQVVN